MPNVPANLTSNPATPLQQSRVFTGFSTANATTTLQFSHYDIDLINIDLSNHFGTHIGDRVMRPNFGCAIWDYLLEPFTPDVQNLIVEEATRVCAFDSRVQILDVQVATFEQGIRVGILLNYLPFNVVQTFTFDFEQRQAALGQ
jgi:phage baseplate assembly protein W